MLFSAAPVEAPADEAPEAAEGAEESVVAVNESSAGEAAAALTDAEASQETQAPVVSGESAIDAAREVTLVELDEESRHLNRKTLEAIAEAAADRWRASGLTAEQSAALDNITYDISDLGGNYLGKTEGYAVTLDDDAAGSGAWFIDPTPGADEEFIQLGADNSLTAVSGTEAAGQYDLLTVVLHEQAHVLGLEDGGESAESDLVYPLLWQNERRLPADGQVDGALPGSVPGPAYMSAAPMFNQPAASGTTGISVVGGVLTIGDTDTTIDNQYVLTSDGTTLTITDNSGNGIDLGTLTGGGSGTDTVTLNFADNGWTGGIVVNGSGGDDNLEINYTGGTDFDNRFITYNGQGDGGAPGDSLTLTGGSFAGATYNYFNANDGSIQLFGQGVINYTGLEPITSTITATDVTLNYSNLAETITVSDSGTAGQTNVNSTLGESTTFNNPTNSLTINGGITGTDTINVTGLGSGFAADLTIDGQGGNDSVEFLTNGTNLGGGNLEVDAEEITVNDAINTGGGDVTLEATGDITIGAAVTTDGGNFTADADSDGDGSGTFTLQGAQTKLTASSGSADANFGANLELSADGSLALIGAPGPFNATNAGAAYLFDTATGTQLFSLNAGGSTHSYGYGVALSADGTRAWVSDLGITFGGPDGRIIEFDANTGAKLRTITVPGLVDFADYLGSELELSTTGAILAVGHSAEDAAGSNSGAVLIFDVSGAPTLLQTILPPNPEDTASMGNQGSMALNSDGSRLIAGTRESSATGADQGEAHIFDTGTGALRLTLVPSDGAAGDEFGNKADLSDDGSIAVVGAFGQNSNSGAVYLFDATGTGTVNETRKLTGTGPGEQFGSSVSISDDGSRVFVGARQADGTGVTYVFDTATGAQLARIAATDAAADDQFGYSVASNADGSIGIAGAWQEDDGGSDAGAAYVLKFPSIAADGGAVSITGADADIGSTISGTSALGFETSTVGRTIGLGGGTGDFNLDDGELAFLRDGFSSITIGGSQIEVVNGTFDSATGWTTSGNVSISGGSARFNGGNTTPNGILSQVVPVTAGLSETVRFDIGKVGGAGASVGLRAEVLDSDGTTVLDTIDVNKTVTGITNHSLTFTASGSTATLRFTDISNNTNSTDVILDNVVFDIIATAGDIDIDTATFDDPVNLHTSGEVRDGAGADITMTTPADTVTIDGTAAPGQSPGILSVTGNFAFADNSTYDAEIGGTTPGTLATNHDQIDVAGTVTIGNNVTLDLSNYLGNYTPAGGDQLVLINNDLADAISGTFVLGTGGTDSNGGQLAEGDTITDFLGVSGLEATVSYLGTDGATGNDFVLTVGTPETRVSIDAGGNLVIEDINEVTNDDLTVEVVGGNLVVTEADTDILIDAQGALDGATGDLTNSVTIALASFTGDVILRTVGGDDTISIENLDLTGTQGLEVEGGTGTDTVNFQGGSSDLNNGGVDVTADGITVDAAIDSGGGGVSLVSTAWIGVNAAISSNSGNITLTADSDNDNDGTADIGAAITAAGGDIDIDGSHATDNGVVITGDVTTTGAGMIDIDGTGGNGAFQYGVSVAGAGTVVSAVNGAITIDGSSSGDDGVAVFGGGVTATGSGTISLTGSGGSGDQDYGVYVLGSTSQVSSNSGAIDFTGTGSRGIYMHAGVDVVSTSGDITFDGRGSNRNGVLLTLGSLVSTGGDIDFTGSSAQSQGIGINSGSDVIATGNGSITFDGTTTGTGDFDFGVVIREAGTLVRTQNGDIDITGDSDGDDGVAIWNGAFVQSTGGGDITIEGTGGGGSGDFGIRIFASATQVTTAGGNISLTGTSAGDDGVSIIRADVTTTGAGTIRFDGTATGGDGDYGVLIDGAGTLVRTQNGDIDITGDSDGDDGVAIWNGTFVQSTGGGDITIEGTGGDGSGDFGIRIFASATQVTTAGGNISLTGTSAGDDGVSINSADVTTTGAGTIRFDGTATGGGGDYGVRLEGPTAVVSTANGAITITGNAANADDVSLTVGTQVTSTSGDITLEGTADAVLTSATVSTGGGDITVNADIVNIGGNVSSTGGDLLITPWTAGTSVGIGGGSGTLNLSDAELGFLQDGFNTITIGALSPVTAFDAGAVDVDSSTFLDDVIILGDSIAVTQLDAGANTVELAARGAITDGGDTGTDVTGANIGLATGTGDIGASGDSISIAGDNIAAATSGTGGNGDIFLEEADAVTIGYTTLLTGGFVGFAAGTGTVTVTGGEFDLQTNAVQNSTTIVIDDGATLDVNGATDTLAGITVNDGGFLIGEGTIDGPITVNNGGTASPGLSPGVIGSGNLTLNMGGIFFVEIDGLAGPGLVGGHDQFDVTGSVTLNDATLSIDTIPGTYTPSSGDSFVIINNDLADGVSGTFAGLAEGTFVSIDDGGGLPDHLFQITYQGGTDSNDVVLTATGAVATTNISIDGSGNLVIDDILGGGTNDNLSIEKVGTDYVIEDLDGNTLGTLIVGATQTSLSRVIVPMALVSGGIDVNVLGGDDTVTLGDLGTLAVGGNLSVDSGVGQDRIVQTGDAELTGAGAVDYDAEQILMDAGSSLTTDSGDVTMDGTGNTGNGAGVELRNAGITSTSGNVDIEGSGGASGVYNRGVLLSLASGVGSTISTGGSISLEGTGGTTGVHATGVTLIGATVESIGAGPVTIDGTGGSGNVFSEGVAIHQGTTVDAGTGDLFIDGTGGSTGIMNRGILASHSDFTSNGGNIEIDGTGGGSLTFGVGAELNFIDTTTTGNGTVTIRGTGASGTLGNMGVKLTGTFGGRGSVSTVNGAITILGTANGNSVLNHGVQITTSMEVGATGSGGVTVTGTGGAGTTTNHGVQIATLSSLSVADGNLAVIGEARGTLSLNRGVDMIGASTLNATGAGNINVTGTGSNSGTGVYNTGINVAGGGFFSDSGDITVNGLGGEGSSLNEGVRVQSSTVTTAGALTLTGTAHADTTAVANSGIHFLSATVNGGAGSAIAGTGGGGLSMNHGISAIGLSSNLGGGAFVGHQGVGATSKELNGVFPV